MPKVMVFKGRLSEKCLHHKGEILMKGLVPLLKETQRVPLLLLACEVTVRRLMSVYEEVGCH